MQANRKIHHWFQKASIYKSSRSEAPNTSKLQVTNIIEKPVEFLIVHIKQGFMYIVGIL